MNINGYYSDKFLTHTYLPQDESLSSLHIWKFDNTTLAEVKIDCKERKFDLIYLNTEEKYLSYLPRLTKCLAKTLGMIFECKKNESLPPLDEKLIHDVPHQTKQKILLKWIKYGGDSSGKILPDMEELLSSKLPLEMEKKAIIKWIKDGGDPNLVLFKDKAPQSLAVYCLGRSEAAVELIECLLDHGLNTGEIVITFTNEDKLVTGTSSLAGIAVTNQLIEIVKLLYDKNIPVNVPLDFTKFLSSNEKELALLSKNDSFSYSPFQLAIQTKNIKLISLILENEIIDLSKSPTAGVSYLSYALINISIEVAQLFLERGAHFHPDETLPPLMDLLVGENKRDFLELLVSYLPLNSFRKIENLAFDDFRLFAEVVAKKNSIQPHSGETLNTLIKHFQLFHLLGHKFGIPFRSDFDIGLGNPINCSTEANDIEDRIELAKSLFESATIFFKEYPQSSFPGLFPLLDDFCHNQEVNTERASHLIERFKKGFPVSLRGLWPEHYVEIFLYQNLLAICNRGDLRPEGSEPGIHFYSFKDREKLTQELLLDIHRSHKLIIDPNKRKSLGLKKQPLTIFVDKEQPGGFCSWNNRKLGFRFLLTLAAMPEKVEEDLIEALWKKYREVKEDYKRWSRFDRDHTLNEALTFYEQNTTFKPPLSLLLFILANYKGDKRETLLSFLLKQNLRAADFNVYDKYGKNPLHHLCSKQNSCAFIDLIKQIDPNLADNC